MALQPLTNQQLTDELDKLKKEVEELKVALGRSTKLQQNFTKKKIEKVDYQFMGKVYRRDGTLVTQINP